MITVVLADDQAMVRAGLRLILESQPDIRVVGEAADGEEALRVARLRRPDVVLMDIRMPRMDGIEATSRLVAEDPAPRVLVVTTFDADQYVYRALRAGASGFVLKDSSPEHLIAAARLVAAGDALLAPASTRRLIEARAGAGGEVDGPSWAG
jgi:DNA-binding NarL/FixJ family response regulator